VGSNGSARYPPHTDVSEPNPGLFLKGRHGDLEFWWLTVPPAPVACHTAGPEIGSGPHIRRDRRIGSLPLRAVINKSHPGYVLRTALVKPAMNSAANIHASSRKNQLTAVSQAAVTLSESVVNSQSARATLVPTGKLRSSPTLTC